MLIACKSNDKNSLHQKIKSDTEEIFDELVQLRRDFHQYPELAGNEKRTSKFIADYLSHLGLEVKTNVAGHGVVGILRGGQEGKTIAWRADMDAIPNDFLDEVPFKSKNKGVQHGCGHDVHMAIGLGIAKVLSKNKKSLHGTVYFIFQPEEETFVGAKNMAQTDWFSKLDIDEIFALHVTGLPVGEIMVKSDELYAYQKILKLTFNDEFSKENAELLYKELRAKTLRKKEGANPWDVPLALDTLAGLRNPNSAFEDYFFLEENYHFKKEHNQATLIAEAYETKSSNLQDILPKIQQLITNSEYRDLFISASFIQENPTVLNDKSLTKDAIKTLKNLGTGKPVTMSYGQIPYFNDDFVYFQQKVPGVYFLLGGSNFEKGLIAMNHAPNFRVDEECIKIGVASFSSLIAERTKIE